MKTLFTLSLALTLFTSSASAVIDGFAMTLNSGNPSYTVPSGKVLILQQVQLPSSASGSSSVISIIDSGGRGVNVAVPGANTNLYKLATPLNLPAGTMVQGPANTGIYGLLVDTSDMYLFVSISSTLANVQFANNTLTGEVRVLTSEPVNVSFQSSTDLQTWNNDGTVIVRRGLGKTRYTFVAANHGENRFYRAVVRRQLNG